MTKRVEKNKKIVKKLEQEEKKEVVVKKSKKLLKWLIIIFILLFIVFYYMRFIETKTLVIKEEKISSEQLPSSFHGLKLVHLSDIHYNTTIDKKDLEKIVAKVNQLKPDIVIFTGDLLDHNLTYSKDDYSTLTTILQKIESTTSKYYIKGEEDYYFSNNMDMIMKDAEFTSLNNKYDIIYKTPDEKILINGLGIEEKNDFKKEEAFIDEQNLFTISLFHEADMILELKDEKIDLALSGHSHGNQINIPLLSELLKEENAKTYSKEFYQVNNTKFYINKGLGTNNQMKLRFLSPPTINFYRLTSKKSNS